MKTKFLLTVSTLFIALVSFSQIARENQWSGSTTLDGNIYRTGNVGIGVSNPTEKLDLSGNISLRDASRFVGTLTNHSLSFKTNNLTRIKINTNGKTYFDNDIVIGKLFLTGDDLIRIIFSKTHKHSYFDYGGNLHFRSNTNGINNGTPLILQKDGNVVIGGGNVYADYVDQAHGYKLAVKGKIIAEEVVVKLHENWPDYVFSPSYTLRPLSEVEEHISNHGHLPEVPNAQQVQDQGISVGEMNAILLKKVEELTLYVIELKKEVEELKEKEENN
jgi:hypothetical protein